MSQATVHITQLNGHQEGQEMKLEPSLDKEVILADLLPRSTGKERRRFLMATKGNVDHAYLMLRSHLAWRDRYLDRITSDEFDADHRKLPRFVMEHASTLSSHFSKVSPSSSKRESRTTPFFRSRCMELPTSEKRDLPQILFLKKGPPYARDGTRLVHMLPAMLDPRITSAEDYTKWMAASLGSQISRDSMEKVTVVVDVREGIGWANPSALKLAPYIKSFSRLMSEHFPERVKRCIVFPVPRSCAAVWKASKKLIDSGMRGKVVLVSVRKTDDSGARHPKMLEYLDWPTIQLLEASRCSLFTRAA